MKNMTIVITAGGVKESIDKVRSITNSSTGKLGLKLAKKCVEELPVTKLIYIHGKEAVPFTLETLNPLNPDIEVETIQIVSTSDLETAVQDVLTQNSVTIFIHSMAVADYTVKQTFDMDFLRQQVITNEVHSEEDFEALLNTCLIETDSKMTSSHETVAIQLKPTPKIIHQIKELSPYTFLVGFKLLENVTDVTLFDVGFNLLRKNRCNLVLVNDLKRIKEGNHEGLLIYPEKVYHKLHGKEEIADGLVQAIKKRAFVKHPKSIQASEDNELSVNSSVYKEFKQTGKALYEKGYLPEVINHNRTDKIGTYGNLSMKINDSSYYMTCRNVHKGQLQPENISLIEKTIPVSTDDSVYANVYYQSKEKPSIDAAIHSAIYKNTSYTYILHTHTDHLYLGLPTIHELYPCGSGAECEAILSCIKEFPASQIIQMRDHGLLLLGHSFEECLALLETTKQMPYLSLKEEPLNQESKEHLLEVGGMDLLQNGRFHNLYLDTNCIGMIWERKKKDSDILEFVIYTNQGWQRKGLGIVQKYLQLYPHITLHLLTKKQCNVVDFYCRKYGFTQVSGFEDSFVLEKKN